MANDEQYRVLVTGVGFLGRGIVRALAEKHPTWRITALDINTPAEDVLQRLEKFFQADVTNLVDSHNPVDSLASTAAPLEAEHSSQEQKDVALRLLHKYRQRMRNKKLERHKTATQKTCDSYFEACLKLASDPEKMQWPYGFYYKKLYLGLVPHLLACLKTVESYAFSAKEKAKIRYRKDEKQDYDGMHKKMNEIKYVYAPV